MIHIHIGLHKTGSTSIQATLKKHASHLEAHDFVVPLIGPRGSGPHHNLAYQLGGKQMHQPAYGGIDELAAMLRARPDASFVLSCEYFSKLSQRQIAPLRAATSAHRVQIIAYFRKPDSLIRSLYMQGTKLGSRVEDFDAFFAVRMAGNHSPSIRGRLQAWNDVFGPASLRLRSFDKLAEQDGLIADFLMAIHLPRRVADGIEPQIRKNVSPGWRAAELCRDLYRNSDAVFHHKHRERMPSHARLLPIRRLIKNAILAIESKLELAIDPSTYLTEAQIAELVTMYELDAEWLKSGWPDIELPALSAGDVTPRRFLPGIDAIDPAVRTEFYRQLAESVEDKATDLGFSLEWLDPHSMRIRLTT